MTNYIENVFLLALLLFAAAVVLMGARGEMEFSFVFRSRVFTRYRDSSLLFSSPSSSSQYFYCSILACSILVNEKHVLKIFSMASHQFTLDFFCVRCSLELRSSFHVYDSYGGKKLLKIINLKLQPRRQIVSTLSSRKKLCTKFMGNLSAIWESGGENVLNKQEINWKIDALDGVDKRVSYTMHAHMKIWKWWWEEITKEFSATCSRIWDRLQSFHTYRKSMDPSIIHRKIADGGSRCCRVFKRVSHFSSCQSFAPLFVCSSRHFHTIQETPNPLRREFTREIKNVLKISFFCCISCELNSISHSNATQMSNKRKNWIHSIFLPLSAVFHFFQLG